MKGYLPQNIIGTPSVNPKPRPQCPTDSKNPQTPKAGPKPETLSPFGGDVLALRRRQGEIGQSDRLWRPRIPEPHHAFSLRASELQKGFL